MLQVVQGVTVRGDVVALRGGSLQVFQFHTDYTDLANPLSFWYFLQSNALSVVSHITEVANKHGVSRLLF